MKAKSTLKSKAFYHEVECAIHTKDGMWWGELIEIEMKTNKYKTETEAFYAVLKLVDEEYTLEGKRKGFNKTNAQAQCEQILIEFKSFVVDMIEDDQLCHVENCANAMEFLDQLWEQFSIMKKEEE